MSIILHPVLKIVGTGRGYLHGGADNGYPCSSKVLIQDSDFVVFFFSQFLVIHFLPGNTTFTFPFIIP